MRWLWLSNEHFTEIVDIDNKGVIVGTPPSLQSFLGQHKSDLIFIINRKYPNGDIVEKQFTLHR